jgi:Lantibiotic dehydratase, N terminus
MDFSGDLTGMSQETLPDHLILLSDDAAGRWALWRDVCVRAAGFPAAGVLKIADAECAAAADRLNAAEAEAEGLREAALAALRGELEASGKERLDGLIKAIRRVKRSQPVTATEGLEAATVAALAGWQEAAGTAAAEKDRYQAAFTAAEERLDRTLRAVAGEDRFREALVWQNRHAAKTGLASLLRRSAEEGRGNARDRGHTQMLASYLQRYCVKNDTIGFFGPVGWAQLKEAKEAITARPGEELLAARQVYFEGWAIDAIAGRLAEDPAMRPWLAPRRSPFLRREGDVYVNAQGQTLRCGPVSTAFLDVCDGTRPALVLARELGIPADQEAALWDALADLQAQGAIRWAFQVPMASTPERTLRELLLAIEDEALREPALAVLDEVVRGRDAVAAAAGDAEGLERALGALETTFSRATGLPATRAGGEVYAGRTLVYEDCRRDLELELGAPLLAEIAPALSLILSGARWLTHYVGQGHREIMEKVYAELSPDGVTPIDFLTFSRAALPRFMNMQTQQEIEEELHARWERVLAVPPGQRRVSYSSEELRPRVLRELSAPAPGWQKARNHSPDLMIAAESVEAIRRGEYLAILGEVHVAINTLDRELFFSQHPHPDGLRAAMESDLPEPSVIPLFPKIWNQDAASTGLGLWTPTVNGRMDLALRSAKDYYLDFCLDPHSLPLGQVLPISDLVVEPDAVQGLIVRPRDGRVRFGVLDFYQLPLTMQVLAAFRVLPSGAYTPRITIDRLVVARESWAFAANELDFAQAATPAERFTAVRRWADRLGLPRFLFAKTPIERKPFYVDLASPVLVEILAKAVRRAGEGNPEASVRLSEMLPEHDRLWLPDAQGNRYTCELRTVVVDLG